LRTEARLLRVGLLHMLVAGCLLGLSASASAAPRAVSGPEPEPPTATITSPAPGGVYLTGESVPTEFRCQESRNGPGIESCKDSNGSEEPEGLLDTSEPGEHQYTVTAKSRDGKQDAVSITYSVVETEPPVATIISPQDGGVYFQEQFVPTVFHCEEGENGTGLESCEDSNGGFAPAGALNTSTTGVHEYTVTATSFDGREGSASISYTVVGAPTTSISAPAGGGVYIEGTHVPTSFSCTEDPYGPGLESCTDSGGASPPKGALDTSEPGLHTYTVTAKSKDGLKETASINYTVIEHEQPSASIIAPAGGGLYAQGAVIDTTFSCREGEGGPGLQSCTDSGGSSGGSGTLKTSRAGMFRYSVTATSKDGEHGVASIQYTVAAPPKAKIGTPAGGAVYAIGQKVATGFACTEGAYGTGIGSCRDSNGSTSPGLLKTAEPGTHTYTVTATSKDGQSAQASIRYTVAAPPEAKIEAPAGGGLYTVGQKVLTRFTCRDGKGGTGIASCKDSNRATSPGTLSTRQPGKHTYTVTAKSKDGQQVTVSIQYTVAAAPTS